MTPKKQNKSSKRRTQVRDLQAPEKKLAGEELKKVKGGSVFGFDPQPLAANKPKQ